MHDWNSGVIIVPYRWWGSSLYNQQHQWTLNKYLLWATKKGKNTVPAFKGESDRGETICKQLWTYKINIRYTWEVTLEGKGTKKGLLQKMRFVCGKVRTKSWRNPGKPRGRGEKGGHSRHEGHLGKGIREQSVVFQEQKEGQGHWIKKYLEKHDRKETERGRKGLGCEGL